MDTGSFHFEADVAGNTLRMHFNGVVTAAEMAGGAGDLEQVLPRLRTGFTSLVDLSELERMDLNTVPYLTKIMDACRTAGIGRVVRVIPDPRKDIGLNILACLHYGTGIAMKHCATLEEAEQALRNAHLSSAISKSA